MLYHVNILDTPNVLKSYSIPLKGTIGSLLYSISQSEKADNKRTYMAAAACFCIFTFLMLLTVVAL